LFVLAPAEQVGDGAGSDSVIEDLERGPMAIAPARVLEVAAGELEAEDVAAEAVADAGVAYVDALLTGGSSQTRRGGGCLPCVVEVVSERLALVSRAARHVRLADVGELQPPA
jgi:hypothetical protein